MSGEPVLYEPGAVATITLNRPDAANALSREALDALRDAAVGAGGDPSVRVVVVTGAGEKAFCAGADLKERANMSDEEVRDYIRTIRDTFTFIERLPQPTIAAINGGAFGGGCELALACDLRLMVDNATIGLTETSLAIIPGAGGTQRLPRIVGPGRALELLLTARRIGADEARAIGLVHERTTAAGLMNKARSLAERIAANGPVAVRLVKEAVRRGMEMPIDEALALETELYERTLGTADRIEGLTAFREKRAPVYRGE